jgi:hypothetical protein
MRKYLFLMVLRCAAMEEVELKDLALTPESHEYVIQKLDAMRDRPWYKSILFWKTNEEYREAKISVSQYLEKLDRLSYQSEHPVEAQTNNLDLLLKASHQVRVEQERKSHKLSGVSKTKIVVGGCTIFLSLIQISLTFIEMKYSPSTYKTLSDLLVSAGGCLSGVMLINDGIKNGDSKADAGRAAHLHLLILEKFQEINAKTK